MRKTKWALKPDVLCDIGAMEQWLEQQAAEGWRLDNSGNYFCVFKRVEPVQVRVRLEPEGERDREARREWIALYEELGWQYAGTLYAGAYYHVFYCDDPAAPELHTDPVAQRWAWEKSLKRAERQGWWNLILAPVGVAVLIWLLWSMGETPWERYLLEKGISYVLALGLLLWLPLDILRQQRNVLRLRRQLEAGVSPEHTGNWRKARRRKAWMLAAAVLIGVLYFGFSFYNLFHSSWVDLEDAEGPLPYVAAEILDDSLDPSQREGGRVNLERHQLAPARYEILEWYPGQAKVETTYDQLLLPVFAAPVMQEKQEAFLADWKDEATVNLVDLEGLDRAILLRGGDQVQMFLGRKGNAVFTVWVNHGVDLSDDLEEFAAVIKEFQP